MSDTFLPQIENIVFLMLENRSLDNVLGWLYADSNPANIYPKDDPNSKAAFDGLIEDKFSNPAYNWRGQLKRYPVQPVPSNLGRDQDRVPFYDPYEQFRANSSWNGVMNQLFGDEGRISALPTSIQFPTNLGFLQDYYSYEMWSYGGSDILYTYTLQQLPVINGLAKMYAVSDAWHSSVPSQTNPNRAFSLCGTSLGRESNCNEFADETFDTTTIFNELGDKTWGLYFDKPWKGDLSYTEYTFPHITKAKNGRRGTFLEFQAAASTGHLPDFSYLEPVWGYGKGDVFCQGTDYHPPTHCGPGEDFLYVVYRALRNSPSWKKTLLIVTFDEHGGTYDHVAPNWTAIPPDGNVGENGFGFNLFGARVPTLLISPYIAASTVFRAPTGSPVPFDHTSFIKTLLLWAGSDVNSGKFGKRMPAAPTFEGVFSDKEVNKGTFVPPARTNVEDDSRNICDLFDGIPFLYVRAILDASKTPADLHALIAKYKDDPAAFAATVSTCP